MARTPRIAYDEWNVWYRTADGTLEERYSFPDALAVATYLNIFVRNCDWVRMANLAQMVNAIAPVVTTTTGAFVQPIYYPVMLHAKAALEEAVDVYVTSPKSRTGAAAADGSTASPTSGRFPPSMLRRRRTPVAGPGRDHNRQPGPGLCQTRSRYGSGTRFLPVEARVTTLTASPGTAGRPAPDIEGVKLEEGFETGKDDVIVVSVPPASFTVIEAGIAGTR